MYFDCADRKGDFYPFLLVTDVELFYQLVPDQVLVDNAFDSQNYIKLDVRFSKGGVSDKRFKITDRAFGGL